MLRRGHISRYSGWHPGHTQIHVEPLGSSETEAQVHLDLRKSLGRVVVWTKGAPKFSGPCSDGLICTWFHGYRTRHGAPCAPYIFKHLRALFTPSSRPLRALGQGLLARFGSSSAVLVALNNLDNSFVSICVPLNFESFSVWNLELEHVLPGFYPS